MSNGRRRQASATFDTKREADEALARALIQSDRGAPPDVVRQTVGEFLDAWLSSPLGLSPSTLVNYQDHVRVYLKPLLGTIRLQKLRAEHLDRMYSRIAAGELGRHPSAATVRRIHATLQSALGFAVRRQHLEFNPAARYPLPKAPRAMRAIWTAEQIAAFEMGVQDDRLGPLFVLAAHSGMRRGELVGLKWRDVHLEHGLLSINETRVDVRGTVVVKPPKSQRSRRTIAIDRATIDVLRRQRTVQARDRLAFGEAYQDSGHVFCWQNGRPYLPQYVSRSLDRAIERIGLPRVVLHGLRTSYASLAQAAGIDLTTVSRHLGHSSSAFTADTYVHVTTETERSAVRRIADVLESAQEVGGGGASA